MAPIDAIWLFSVLSISLPLVLPHPYRQGRSQNYTKGALNSAGLCSVETQIHCLAKHLATKENAHHLVYDYSHYTVKLMLFASYMCIIAY